MELEVEALSPENMPVAEGAEPEPEALSPENMTVAEATEPEPEDPGGGLEN
jgi:hypothetical protein